MEGNWFVALIVLFVWGVIAACVWLSEGKDVPAPSDGKRLSLGLVLAALGR
jgi:hypothetical protein